MLFNLKNMIEGSSTRLDLKFRDEEFEKGFRAERCEYQLKVSKPFIYFIIIFSIVLWIQSDDPFHINYLVFNISKIPMGIFYYAFSRFCPGKIEIVIIAVFLPLAMGTINNSLDFQKNRAPLVYYFNGMSHHFLILSGLLLKFSWINMGLTSTAINALIVIKQIDEIVFFRPLSTLIGNVIFYTIFAYFSEKEERNRFFRSKKSESSLLFYQSFIQHSLPIGVVALGKDSILFNNEVSLKFLASENEKILDTEHLNNITIEEGSPPVGISLLEKIADKYNNEKMGKMELSVLLNPNRWKDESEFVRYKGWIPKKGKQRRDCQHVTVKLSKLLWKNEFGIIILISEDPDSLKLNLLKQCENYKDQVLSSVSHQLRTPLNGIMGTLETVYDSLPDLKTRETLETALKSSQRILSVINDIIDFGQMSLGKFSLIIKEFNLEEVINEISDLVKIQAKANGVDFLVENKTNVNMIKSERKSKFLIRNDPQRLKQVLLNFLDNSLRFTKNGYIKLAYEIIEDSSADNLFEKPLTVYFTVEDTGCGIKESMRKSLFKFLGKLEGSGIKEINTEGLGFGLAISHKLLEYMNDNQIHKENLINLKSEVGVGSAFSFFLKSFKHMDVSMSIDDFSLKENTEYIELKPYTVIKNKSSLFIEDESESLVKKSKSMKKILVVEDDPINTLVVTRHLDYLAEYEYTCASNGLKAIEFIKTFAQNKKFFNLILMDCNMPVMDGFVATAEIKKLIEQNIIPSVSVLAITANTLPADIDRCFACGMVDYLTKPLTRQRLKEKILQYIK